MTLAEVEFGIACSGDPATNREHNKNALDKLIASHALALNIVLVTHNEADFPNYPDLADENWVNSH